MSQFDFVIIAPLTISLILTLFFYYYFSLKLTVKIIKTLKFRKKILKIINPLSKIASLKNITYFDKKLIS